MLTIVRGRQRQLENLHRGLAESDDPPSEWIIVGMGEDVHVDGGASWPVRCVRIDTEGSHLPLAEARNRAAEVSRSNHLIFLDVDCIPHPTMIATFREALETSRSLWMGSPRYLPAGQPADNWDFGELETAAVSHPLQPNLKPGEQIRSNRYELLWSLCFAISRDVYQTVGGFDSSFEGYGGEDTDFAWSARRAKIPFGFVGALAYHQHHAVHRPPLNHFDGIVANAIRFRAKWGGWPMKAWLDAFVEMRLIEFDPLGNELVIRQRPTQTQIEQSLHHAPAGF